MKPTTTTTTLILLVATFVVLLVFPVSKIESGTYFDLFRNRITNPGEGMNLFQSILLLIPFIGLLLTTFWFISYYRDKEMPHLEKVRWYSLTTFIAFATLNVYVSSEIIGDKNLSFLVGVFPYLILSFSMQIESATGRTKIWFNEPAERPKGKWYSSRAMNYFVWGVFGLYIFFVILAKLGCNPSSDKAVEESYKNTTFTEIFYSFPNFLFGSILVYFGYVIYKSFTLTKAETEAIKKQNESPKQ